MPGFYPKAKSWITYTQPLSYDPLYHGLQFWGQPLVRVSMNGRVPGTFMADTGNHNGLLTDDATGLLGLTPQPVFHDGKPYLFYGDPARSVDVTLHLGEFKLAFPMIVVPQGQMFSSVPALSGILGMNSLKFFAVLFDFRLHTISLVHPGVVTAEHLTQLGMSSAYAFPLIPDPDDRPYVMVSLVHGANTVTQKMLVDTGSTTTVVSRALASQLNLHSERVGKSSAFSGTVTTHGSHIDRLSIGSMSLFSQSVEYFDKDDSIAGQIFPSVLGLDVLTRYRVLLDFPAGKMYLAPPSLSVPVKPSAPDAPAAPAPAVSAPADGPGGK